MHENQISSLLGKPRTSQLEGDKARLEDVRETLALSEGAVVERQEVHRLARAVIVVPDGHAIAEDGVLGIQVSAEGIVVNAPVTVDSGLVAGHRSDAHIGGKLGLANCGAANVARLPGEETNAGDGEAGVDSHGKGGRGGNGLFVLASCIHLSVTIEGWNHLREVHLGQGLRIKIVG